jgi:beta-N-acetylhexosaminidase
MTVRHTRMLIAGLLSAGLVAGCGSSDQAVPASTAAETSSAAAAAQSGSMTADATSPGADLTTAESTGSTTTAPAEPSTSQPSTAPPPAAPMPATAVPPNGLVTSADMAAANAAVGGMSVADQAGTVVMVSSADAVGTDLVSQLHLGGVILMGSKGAIDGTEGGTPEEVAGLTAQLQSQVPASQSGAPLLIATDQEYGLVTRLVNGFTDFPGAEELSGISDTGAAAAQTQAVTAAAGAELLAVGVNVDFAPDADVLPESGPSGIDDRSFGSDPERTGTLVAAAVQGYQSAGLAATIKHFPGIGRTATDTHKALPTLDEGCAEWNAVESVPMRAGVDAGVALVMTGHIALPAIGVDGQSSALAGAAVTDLLKGSSDVKGCNGLNFAGVAVSDSFQMAPVVENYGPAEAAWRGIAAGQDLVLMPVKPAEAVAGISNAVADGSLPTARLQDAATTVYALRLALARSARPGLDVVGSAAHADIAAEARAAG